MLVACMYIPILYITAWMLRPTRDPTNEAFAIEKVLAKRTDHKTKKKQVLVKYLHYDRTFNQWINQENVITEDDNPK